MASIVIIDDRITNRNIFAKLATSIEEGVTVKAFGDPAEALGWLENNPSELVITDFKMPQMDGAEFVRHLRQIPSAQDVPVVVITVYEERSFRLRALEAGATDFLHSPVDHHEFVTRARNLLKMHRQQVELAKRAVSLARELEVSERSRQTALRDSSERLAQVIDTLPAMISANAPDGTLLFVNAYQTNFAGLAPKEVEIGTAACMFGAEHKARSEALNQIVVTTAKPLASFEEEFTDSNGTRRTFLTIKAPLKDIKGNVGGVLTSSLDITSRKKMEARLRHLAHYDQLTGLPNRVLMDERMRALIARARRGDKLFALHLIDLDGFKRVNDLFGHSAGDRFLRKIADHLRGGMRDSDLIARLGGDEFAILQTDVANSEDAAAFAQRVLIVVSECSHSENEALAAAASIGIALHPTDGADAEDLLKNADLAMYKAKADGGNLFCFYAADMQTRARTEAMLDNELRTAVQEEQFVLYYQPQLDLVTREIIGAEALIRWRRPGHGIVAPGVFLSRTEETGLILPINEWVLRAACLEAKTWQKPGMPPLRVSVNMSPVQFRKRTVPLLVARILADTGFNPQLLDLELTEGIMMHDIDAVAIDLKQILNLGVSISIDDFGTGFSSLGYVKRFPAHRIKIDQSFIRNLAVDTNDMAIVKAIVTLGRSLKLKIVAEGVETLEQANLLTAEGVDEVQGYYFGRPMPASEFRALIYSGAPLARSA